jgi:hypothetical protein
MTNNNARQLAQKQHPTFAIEAYRSKASVYGEARALVKRAGKPRTFATFAEAQAEANRLQADLAVDTVSYSVIEI